MTYTETIVFLLPSILHGLQRLEMVINIHAKGKGNKKLLKYTKTYSVRAEINL